MLFDDVEMLLIVWNVYESMKLKAADCNQVINVDWSLTDLAIFFFPF